MKAGQPDATALAQAIYVAELFPGKAGVQGSNTATATWRTEQAQAWCEQQTTKLPTVDETE